MRATLLPHGLYSVVEYFAGDTLLFPGIKMDISLSRKIQDWTNN